jgi:hypothetical protein
VIDGVRIKKKQPFTVTEVPRLLVSGDAKADKEQTPYLPAQDVTLAVEEKNFFTEKSYEDLADKRMDYGMIRFSSLSSMRGELFSLGHVQEMPHNFSYYGSSGDFRQEAKRSIFENQFSLFVYITEDPMESDEGESNMIDH